MSDERLVEIESKLTLQEDLLQDLNHTVYTQQKKLERLEALVEALLGQIRELGDSLAERGATHERPPHY